MVIFINFSHEGLLVLEFWLSKANILKKKKKAKTYQLFAFIDN